MEKIKKRAHWNNFHSPHRPRIPIEPKKTFTILSKIKLQDEDYDRISFENLEIPKGFTYKDLEVGSEWNDEWAKSRLIVYLRENRPNSNYDKEFVKYSEDLIKYEENLANWEKEIIEYNAWKKQEEEELLKKQIAEAKKFLKKHDKDSK